MKLHSFNVVFDDFKEKIKTYPPKLQKLLKIAIEQVENQGQSLTRTFGLLKTLSLLPAISATLVVLIKYWDSTGAIFIKALISIISEANIDPMFIVP